MSCDGHPRRDTLQGRRGCWNGRATTGWLRAATIETAGVLQGGGDLLQGVARPTRIDEVGAARATTGDEGGERQRGKRVSMDGELAGISRDNGIDAVDKSPWISFSIFF